jgi:hypothetical protein
LSRFSRFVLFIIEFKKEFRVHITI